MMRRIFPAGALLLLAALLLCSCTTAAPKEVVFEAGERQQQLREMQTRQFDLADRIATMRTVILTLQDLGFVINQADSQLGFISATKLNGYSLHISVMVAVAPPDRMAVRASLQAGAAPIEEESYQIFFASLATNLFRQ